MPARDHELPRTDAAEMDYPGLKALLKAHPELMKINSHIQQKPI